MKMLHKDMDSKQRTIAERIFKKSETFEIELFSEEPYIKTDDGTKFYIDVIDIGDTDMIVSIKKELKKFDDDENMETHTALDKIRKIVTGGD